MPNEKPLDQENDLRDPSPLQVDSRPLPTAGQDFFSNLSFQSLSGLFQQAQPLIPSRRAAPPVTTKIDKNATESRRKPSPSSNEGAIGVATAERRSAPAKPSRIQSPPDRSMTPNETMKRQETPAQAVPNPFQESNTSGRPTNANGATSPSNWGLRDRRLASQTSGPVGFADTTAGVSTSTLENAPRLTHVNTAGEAHMVDVGHKALTRRTAVAGVTVTFSKKEAYDLVVSNQIAKGDVLSTARIAGIMASKRCSELIPLCHPIAISKVEMVMTPTENPPPTWRPSGSPSINIQAVVDCTGQTGVEMEALTAATVAALTVYDMCKAVDKAMVIENARLVYKSGGKSGDFMNETWKLGGGYSDLVQRGLLKQTPSSHSKREETVRPLAADAPRQPRRKAMQNPGNLVPGKRRSDLSQLHICTRTAEAAVKPPSERTEGDTRILEEEDRFLKLAMHGRHMLKRTKGLPEPDLAEIRVADYIAGWVVEELERAKSVAEQSRTRRQRMLLREERAVMRALAYQRSVSSTTTPSEQAAAAARDGGAEKQTPERVEGHDMTASRA